MDFPFDVWRALKPDNAGVAVLESKNLASRTREVCQIIDAMGYNSARAQGLPTVITTAGRFFSTGDNKLFFKVGGNQVLGFLKIGYRRLFHTSGSGQLTELYPLCLLDFYVHENCQRFGIGKELHQRMLQAERTTPAKLAIDRPSAKLIQFMRKHYGLSDYVPQTNNFVIFNQFFEAEYRRAHSTMPKTSINVQEMKRNYWQATPPRGKEEFKMNARTILGQNRATDYSRAAPYANLYNPLPPWATAEAIRSRTSSYLNR